MDSTELLVELAHLQRLAANLLDGVHQLTLKIQSTSTSQNQFDTSYEMIKPAHRLNDDESSVDSTSKNETTKKMDELFTALSGDLTLSPRLIKPRRDSLAEVKVRCWSSESTQSSNSELNNDDLTSTSVNDIQADDDDEKKLISSPQSLLLPTQSSPIDTITSKSDSQSPRSYHNTTLRQENLNDESTRPPRKVADQRRRGNSLIAHQRDKYPLSTPETNTIDLTEFPPLVLKKSASRLLTPQENSNVDKYHDWSDEHSDEAEIRLIPPPQANIQIHESPPSSPRTAHNRRAGGAPSTQRSPTGCIYSRII